MLYDYHKIGLGYQKVKKRQILSNVYAVSLGLALLQEGTMHSLTDFTTS